MTTRCCMVRPAGPISASPVYWACVFLQEWNDLSDQEALDTFSFDMRWRYALDVSDEEDYLLPPFSRRIPQADWPPKTPT